MAAPVWSLSVDLQAKTATFQSGLAEAARSARGSFTSVSGGAAEMSGHVNTNMFASRHAIMAVSEAFGVQMPRAITALITHVGPLGAALEAAFPFAAIALAAVLLIEEFQKLKDEGIKLTEDQVKFGTEVQNAFNKLDESLIRAGVKTAELKNDHLGALRLELQLIDRQSMDQLVHTFGEIAKAADTVFADLKSHWYTFGIGSDGAKHALDQFQNSYDSLLSKGKDQDAADLLRGTRQSAQKILDLQNQAKNTSGSAIGHGDANEAKLIEHEAALNGLKAAGVGFTDKEVKSQELLVQALNDQVAVEGKVAALKSADKGNAKTSTGKEMSAIQAAGQKEAADHAKKMAEMSLSMEREAALAQLGIREAGITERLAADVSFADKTTRIELDGNQALIAALDKGGKDYNNQLQALKDKAAEIHKQHEVTVSGLANKAQEAQYRLDLANLEESERESIAATDKGGKERLAAITAAIKEEQARHLQNTTFYRDLLKQKVTTEREMTSEADKLAADAGKEAAEHEMKMGELGVAALKERDALADSARRVSIQRRLAEEIEAANQTFTLKQTALMAEAAALDKGGRDYDNKLKAIQNKEKQLTTQHENEITAIRDKAETERNQKILAASTRFNDSIASGLSEVIMGHQNFASMMNSLGNQVVSGMIQNAIQSIIANDMTKESDAASAARKAFNSGMKLPFPANIIAAPVMGVAAFAAVMAFQDGTDSVPGIGKGDKVPAMLEPGEGVVPGGVMDGLRGMARSGGMQSGNQYHAHITFAPQIQAIDSNGVQGMLDKHAPTIQKHVETAFRKLNR